MSTTEEAYPNHEETAIKYVCGIEVGSQFCSGCILRPDNTVVVEPFPFANASEGWQVWEEHLKQLDALPAQILIGIEATSAYVEHLYHELEQHGYMLRLGRPRETHRVQERHSHRAKPNRAGAMAIARALLSGEEAGIDYLSNERAVAYWKLEHTKAELARLQSEIEQLFTDDPKIKGLKSIPEPGSKTEEASLTPSDEATAGGSVGVENKGSVTLDSERPESYGTTPAEYKLWVDYMFDWFGATLDRRFRRYLVAFCFTAIIWGLGFMLSLMIGFTEEYLTTPAVYFFVIGIAWCTNALRWLSQVYHVRTNAVRPCFLVDDASYKRTVSPFALDAVRNKRIFLGSSVIAVLVLGYFGAIMFGLIEPLSSLALGFPPSFPAFWLTGNFLLIKLAILSLFFGVAFVEVYTGAQLTRSTAPLYAKLAALPVIPLPSLVTELFQGVLRLYLTGALMWSFGIVLVELLYEAQADALGIGFLIVVLALGVFAYLAPREAVRKIWQKAKHQALYDVMLAFHAKSASHDAEELKAINEYIQSLNDSEPGKLNIVQFISFLGGQLLPVITLIANTVLPSFNLLEVLFKR